MRLMTDDDPVLHQSQFVTWLKRNSLIAEKAPPVRPSPDFPTSASAEGRSGVGAGGPIPVEVNVRGCDGGTYYSICCPYKWEQFWGRNPQNPSLLPTSAAVLDLECSLGTRPWQRLGLLRPSANSARLLFKYFVSTSNYMIVIVWSDFSQSFNDCTYLRALPSVLRFFSLLFFNATCCSWDFCIHLFNWSYFSLFNKCRKLRRWNPGDWGSIVGDRNMLWHFVVLDELHSIASMYRYITKTPSLKRERKKSKENKEKRKQ